MIPRHINVLSNVSRHINHRVLPLSGLTLRRQPFSRPSPYSSMSSDPTLDELRDKWNCLYRTRLPSLAKAKDPAQPKWPVQLDHCFARIVLDNAVGKDKPWPRVLKSPAYKNMSRKQLEDAIELGEKLANGDENLVKLDEKSLALRGKKSKLQGEANSAAKKRKVEKASDEGGDGKPEGHKSDEARAGKRRTRQKLKTTRSENES